MKKIILVIITGLMLVVGTDQAMAWGPNETLIAPTKSAATKELVVPEGLGSSLQLVGTLSGAEEITLQRCITWTDESTCASWETMEIGGSTVTGLSDTNHVITMYGAMRVRIYKPTTAAVAGVDWQR